LSGSRPAGAGGGGGASPGGAGGAAGEAGSPGGGGARAASNCAIVVGRFYAELAERLLAGATAAFAEHGAAIEVFDVPGAYELPLGARYAADTGRFDGVACLGAVIRGETDHYDYVCAEAARGIMQVQLETGVPCAFGVLTCATMEQALARAGGGKRDQGRHAAEAVLAMAALRERLAQGRLS
jgi:6,7-dimethyl-8-ribityllumazine synthase